MNDNRLHGLHRIGEVLRYMYPEFFTQINHKPMEYFKVTEHNSKVTMEVNRDELGDFQFTLITPDKEHRTQVYLSQTEAKDLSEFILKRLGEKQPDEVRQPF